MTVIPKLAALFYYDAAKKADPKGNATSFETLAPDIRAPWEAQASLMLKLLDKLNLAVTNKTPPPALSPQEAHERLLSIITDLLAGVKVWKRDVFPVDELAYKITEGGFHV